MIGAYFIHVNSFGVYSISKLFFGVLFNSMSPIDIIALNPFLKSFFSNIFCHFGLVKTPISPGTGYNCVMTLSIISRLSVNGKLEDSNF